MYFSELDIRGAYHINVGKIDDERGFFARAWCADEFRVNGLPDTMVQASISYNIKKGTVRGLHYQSAPSQEGKLVRCTSGSVFDVIVDLRPNSISYRKCCTAILSAADYNALYVPPGVAHGFQTLADDVHVFYMMTDYYRPEYASGVRWDDPIFNIKWPAEVSVISERDRHYPDFRDDMTAGFSDY
jgi:dTDP-4-dehydrorhamnose 3,5-epimerase